MSQPYEHNTMQDELDELGEMLRTMLDAVSRAREAHGKAWADCLRVRKACADAHESNRLLRKEMRNLSAVIVEMGCVQKERNAP